MTTRHDKLVGVIILAAGGSTRFGTPKQLFKYQGHSLVRRAAITALNCNAGPVVVSVGANREEVQVELSGLDVATVANTDWQQGMSTSLILALDFFTREFPSIDAVLFLLCDQPRVDAAKLIDLLEAYETTGEPIVASEYNNTLGVPALFDRSMFGELMRLTGDQGAKSVIKHHINRVRRVSMPEAAFDIDSLADVEPR